MVFGNKTGRSNALVSRADKENPFEHEHHHHQSPLKALKSMGDKLRPHTAITTTEDAPGVSDHDVAAGTAAPIAQRANQDAMNAGVRRHGRSSMDTFRSATKSLYSSRSRTASNATNDKGHRPEATAGASDAQKQFARDGSTDGKAEQPANDGSTAQNQSQGPHAAQHPEKYLSGNGPKHGSAAAHATSGHEPRLATTQTSFKATTAQSERAQRIMQRVQGNDAPSGSETVAPAMSRGPLSPRSRQYYVPDAPSPQQSLSPTVPGTPAGAAEMAEAGARPPPPPSASTRSNSMSRTHSGTGIGTGSSKSSTSDAVTAPDSASTQASSKGSTPALPDKSSDHKNHDIGHNLPNGAVPGLAVGDDEPGLPGQHKEEDSESTKARKHVEQEHHKEQEKSENMPDDVVNKKFGTRKDQLVRQRHLQADYTGWRQIGGWDQRAALESKEDVEDLLQRSTLLEYYVSDKYIGDWYQNTVLIVATATMAWLIGHFGFSISWLSLVLLFTATAYRSSMRRLRRNYRDDLVREQSLQRAENDVESMEWLNSFLVKFWLIYEPSLSAMITQIGNEVLAEQTPGFIDSILLQKFTLGTKAPRVEFVRSFPKTDAQVAVIDLGASFTPNDTVDLTARQLRTKVNPKVQLGIRVGKSVLSKNFPVLLEDMSFVGKMRLRIKLMERFPHIQTVDFSFLEPPDFDFVLKPIGGDTFGFDINIIPGLSKFIKDMVNANLGPMFYAPNAFQINVEQLMAGVGVMTGVGVLSINLKSARRLKPDQDGRVDPYVRVLSRDKKELARTKIKANNSEPVWNETLNVIITALNETVLLETLDFNEETHDRALGITSIRVDSVPNGDVTRAITSGGRSAGELTFSAKFASVQMPSEDDSNSARDTKSGILGLKVVAARELDASKSKVGKLSPFCEIELDGRLVDSTRLTRDNNNPEWNYAKEHIILNKLSSLVVLRVRDNRKGHHKSPQVGTFKMRLAQLLVECEKGRLWFPLQDGKGEIRVETQWKPVNVSVGGSASNYVEPVGVLRLHVKRATDLRNLEHVGKVDPYTRVFLGHRQVARTDWFKNELNPTWDQVLYIPVQNELQNLTLEVMDVEKRAKDRSLGAFKIDLSTIIQKDDRDNYKVFVSDEEFTNRLVTPNRGPKGSLTYTIEFYPAIPVVSPVERLRLKSERKVIEDLKAKGSEMTPKERDELDSREDRMAFAGVDMPIEQQLQYESGVFAFAIVAVRNAEPGHVISVFANNQPYPVFVSPPVKGKVFVPDECGDFVSGQMHLSNLRFEIGNGDPTSGNVSYESEGELSLGCRELMQNASYESRSWKLGNAEIEIQARFFPVPDLVIDDSEDISNNGSIEVKLHKCENVKPADRTGLSDPYVGIYLNNSSDRVYRTRTIKETLNPVFEEQFRLTIADYKASFMKAMVYDWDMGNSDDFLGGARFDFSELEPLEWRDLEDVPLEMIKKTRDPSHIKESQGTMSISLRFLPGVLPKDGGNEVVGLSSVNKMAGAAAGAGVGAVGAAASHGHGFLSKLPGIHRGDDASSAAAPDTDSFSIRLSSVRAPGHEYVQVRGYVITKREKEVFRTQTFKLEAGHAELTDSFEVHAFSESELGLKIVAVKSLGRHADVGQGSVRLTPGDKKADLGNEVSVSLNVEHNA